MICFFQFRINSDDILKRITDEVETLKKKILKSRLDEKNKRIMKNTEDAVYNNNNKNNANNRVFTDGKTSSFNFLNFFTI